MIFIVNNNRQYSDRRLYFVEAPLRFEHWFNKTLVPFLKREEVSYLPTIVARAEKLEWRGENSSCSVEDFLDHVCFGTEHFPPTFS